MVPGRETPKGRSGRTAFKDNRREAVGAAADRFAACLVVAVSLQGGTGDGSIVSTASRERRRERKNTTREKRPGRKREI
jgi:hypothetical protein